MKIKSIILIIGIYFLAINNLLALDPEVFVQSTVNRASKTLSEEITKEEKMLQLQKIAKDTVDIKGIGFYTLGSIRKTLNEDQKKRIC